MEQTQSIVPATFADRDGVMALYSSMIGLPGCTWGYDYPSAETIDHDLAHGWLYCLRQGDVIVGVVSVGNFGELTEGDIPWSAAQRPCEIGRIGVLPAAQGQGLGRRLLELALGVARRQGFDAMRLLVSPGNAPALALYRRAGFRTVGETDRYDIHWLCMELALRSMAGCSPAATCRAR